jgi:hypothetical protein
MSYAKLDSSIVTSTIWAEPPATCKVWITMLAMADSSGYVGTSVPGLAHVSRVSITEAEEAIRVLSSPDPHSRTADNEGRRIAPVDRGFQILNYQKFREGRDEENRREQNRLAQKRYRERHKESSRQPESTKVSQRNGLLDDGKPQSAHAEAEAEADRRIHLNPLIETLKLEDPQSPEKLPSSTPEVIYAEYPRKVGKTAALKAIRIAMKSTPADRLLERTQAYADAVSRWPASESRFVPNPATWFNRGSYDDDPATWEGKDTPTNGKKPAWAEDEIFVKANP